MLATDSLVRRDDAMFFTARKLFTFAAQPHVAVAVCGLLTLGRGDLRPIATIMDAFSTELEIRARLDGNQRLPTAQFAEQLGAYIANIWRACMPPDDSSSLELVVAGYDLGMPYGELYGLQVPGKLTPHLERHRQLSFFHGLWGDVNGSKGMTDPHYFPFDIMPLQACAVLTAHLITSTARLEVWSTTPQEIGGLARVVTITQADGALRLTKS